MSKSNIEWTDYSWNPVTGCDKVSQGCKNCYAGNLAQTRLKHLPMYKDGFYGNVQMHPKKLTEPLHWRTPRTIFVNSMSDLFHPDVSYPFIAAIFDIMERCPQHRFIILTKRPKLALEWFRWYGKQINKGYYMDPFKNVALMVRVEDQQTASERIPYLLSCPAAIRGISAEPLLGQIDEFYPEKLDWIICGGESGAHARPCYPSWVTKIHNLSICYEVPFFFKQWGSYKFNGKTLGGGKKGGRMLGGLEWNFMPKIWQ